MLVTILMVTRHFYYFLLGRRSNNTPVIKIKKVDITLRGKWKAVQAASNMFWSQWTQEYILILTERKKWSSLNVNVKKGELVLLYDKNLKRSHWPLGRVVETLPGPYNVRVVKIQTKDSIYVKSVACLALLECSNDRVGVV